MTGIGVGRRFAGAIVLGVLLTATEYASAGSCTVSTSGMGFGNYQPFSFPGEITSTAITSNATISMRCSSILLGGEYAISLGPSTVGNGDRISTRYLSNTNGGPHMAFNIYLDSNYMTVWGNGSTGGVIKGTILLGDSDHSHTVHGRIPAEQSTLKAGSFSDTLTMTLTYNP